MRPTSLRFPSSASPHAEGSSGSPFSKKTSRKNKNAMSPEDAMLNGADADAGRQAQTAGSGPLPMLTLPSTVRNNIVATLGEFVGTFLFLFFSFAGTQVANMSAAAVSASNLMATEGLGSPPDPTTVIFISLCFGLSLMANVWAFYRVTGGAFNPCVTMALFLVGGLPASRSFFVIIAQLLGGIAAAGVVSGLFPGPLAVNTTLGGNASVAQGLFIEMFLTAELVFVIIMVAVEKHKSTYLAPIAIGVSFFLCELVGVYFTGGSLNPARSLGPAVVNASFPGYFWIYVVGPGLGALVACGFYVLLKWLRWRECNPGQDWDDMEKLHYSEKPLTDQRPEEPEEKPVTPATDATTAAAQSPGAEIGHKSNE
ncbi:aquaporin-like protein [Naviculisporaceae sp. PSN 640]